MKCQKENIICFETSSQCLSQKYSDECPLDIFNTLHSSASTVQSYTAIKRNMSHDGFEKTGKIISKLMNKQNN